MRNNEGNEQGQGHRPDDTNCYKNRKKMRREIDLEMKEP